MQPLETSVLATLCRKPDKACLTLTHLLDRVCPQHAPELTPECWYLGSTSLPLWAIAEDTGPAAERFARACDEKQVEFALISSVVVCARRFNELTEQAGSKGAVLAHGLTELLHGNRRLGEMGDRESMAIFVDKHGGRNHYAALLQHALSDGMVVAEQESMARSVYRVLGLERELRLTFQPRADAEHFCVALASMISKYLRELFMHEYNRFWQTHLPTLKPTAGYPLDARRFFTAIRPVAERLGLTESSLWRQR